MKFLTDLILDYSSKASPDRRPLATHLQNARNAYDCRVGDSASARVGFEGMVQAYNFIGKNKELFGLKDNFLRNLTGALLQDYMLSLVYEQLRPYPKLDVFTEAQVALGLYPLWAVGVVKFETVSEQSDLAVGYLWDTTTKGVVTSPDPWPRPPRTSIPKGCTVLPLITISSKIRVSKQEFFDWLGRSQLMGKGNPHCLNIEVGLRREMRIAIVEVAQVYENFFLLGTGDEGKVVGYPKELERLLERIRDHLVQRMGAGGPASEALEEDLGVEPEAN